MLVNWTFLYLFSELFKCIKYFCLKITIIMTTTMMLYDDYSDEMKVTYDEECNNYSLACFFFFW